MCDCWQFFSLPSHLGKLVRKPRCSLFWCRQETTGRNLTPLPPPLAIMRPLASVLLCLLRLLLDLLLKAALPSQRGRFIPSWLLCSIFNLSILTRSGWRFTLFLQNDHNNIKKFIIRASYLHCMLSVCSKYSQQDFIIILLFPSAL